MNKNKKFFSYGLFKEGLRQTRIIGLVGLITILAITALIWFGKFADSFNYIEKIQNYTRLYGVEVSAVLLLQYCVICPLMVLFLFRFLNKRDAADLYHALPYSRECVTLSYFSSVMAWNLITTCSTLVLVAGLYNFTPGMAMNLSQLFWFGFNVFSAQFTVAASVLFAMSITGTAFSNVTVSLLVIFLPRLVITALGEMMDTACVIVDIEKQFPFLNPTLNVASGVPIAAVQTASTGRGDALLQCLIRPINGLYTLGLGLVLLVAAVWLLRKRKSETAGKSSPNRVLQGVYRIALGSVLGLVPVYMVFQGFMNQGSFYLSDIVILLILVFLVALFYFLFELITTKKVQNILKAIPGFAVVLIIDAVLLGITLGLSNQLLGYLPTAEQMESVYLLNEDENYFDAKCSNIPLEDKPTKTLVAKVLEETVALVQEGRLHRDVNSLYGGYGEEGTTSLKVRIAGSEGDQYRYLLIEQDDYDFLIQTLENHEKFKDILYQIPTPQTHTMTINTYNEGLYLEEQQKEALFATAIEEIKALPFEQWYALAKSIHYMGKERVFDIATTVEYQGKSYSIIYPITKEQFPKTFDLFMTYWEETSPSAQSLEEFKKALAQISQTKKIHEEFDVGVTVWYPITEYMTSTDNWLGAVETVLEYAKPYTPGTNDVIVDMSLQQYVKDGQVQPKSYLTRFMIERKYIELYLEETFRVFE